VRVFNPSPWARAALVAVPKELLAPDAVEQESAVMEDPGALVEVSVPALGWASVPTGPARGRSSGAVELEPARADARALENSFFRLELDDAGEMCSLADKRVSWGRELFRPGAAGNHLEAFDDRPEEFDAWDIASTFERKRYPVEVERIELLEEGPLRASIRVVKAVLSSRIEQRICVYRLMPRIDFVTEIDWHEHHVLLKAGFPLDLRTTVARAETAYGSVERPTHRNTSWDAAQFEVPAHRWVDLSEGDYGVSLLNNGRYGHDVHGATVRITLLRSPTSPDPTADQGRHSLTYSLFPHPGEWRRGGTVRAAYELNRVVRVHRTQPRAARPTRRSGVASHATSMLSASPDNVVVEAVKRARDTDGIVVRVYESSGCRCRAEVRTAFALASLTECDLLERPLTGEASRAYEQWRASPVASHDAPVRADNGWSFELRPYEVRSFVVRAHVRG
jgi:alpha-mannosidase